MNASDPSGAVIDVDGDGAIDVEDNASESYIRTPVASPLRSSRRAAMIAAVTDAVARAAAAAVTYETVAVGDGTPYGRFNSEWRMSRPDGWDWTLTASGATFEIIGYCPPLYPYCRAIGLGVDFASNGRTVFLWSQGGRTALDVALDVGDTFITLFTPAPGSLIQAAAWVFLPVVDRAAGPDVSLYTDSY